MYATICLAGSLVVQRDCFIGWVGVKVSKRMENFRIGHDAVKNVLVPISFGASSLSLLALLDKHLGKQKEKTNRVGYELSVLHVLGADAHEAPASAISKFEQLKKMFSNHRFYTVTLEDGIKSSSDDSSNLPLAAESLQNLSASSHEDMMLIIRDRLIMQQARRLSCTDILYGDSMSKLSERVLAETAKGRGFALPQLIGEATPLDEISCVYPLQDIFRSEIEEYLRNTLPELWKLASTSEVAHAESRTASARNMTIDKLMAQYVTEMEGNTPSVVANVLRTSAKLKQPPRSQACQVCGMAMDEGTAGLRGWGGDQAIDIDAPAGSDTVKHTQLCYGCTRSLKGG